MVWFVIPVLDERENLEALFADLGPRAAALGARVVLVDDGSTDGSADVARAAAGALPLRVVTHEVNRGLGAAVASGLAACLEEAQDGDAIVTLEGDNTSDLDDLGAMLARFDAGADLVLASFFAPGGHVHGVTPGRALASKGVSTLFRWLGGLREFHQVTPLFRVYRAGMVRRGTAVYGDGLIQEEGFAVNVELLVKLRYCGAAVAEVPTTMDWSRRRGVSKLPLRSTVAAYVRLLGALGSGRMRPRTSLEPEPR
ncbi:MAG: hypothetical protein QOE65_918 [Solirubrobacteraceae bacterium]|jgi:dolichol-phosphate mannosyltransferase|nr:hypothetical protein [Solirubrobacteraceae bacterium]